MDSSLKSLLLDIEKKRICRIFYTSVFYFPQGGKSASPSNSSHFFQKYRLETIHYNNGIYISMAACYKFEPDRILERLEGRKGELNNVLITQVSRLLHLCQKLLIGFK